MRTECACGTVIEGAYLEVVVAMIEHAHSAHARVLTVDQVERMLRPT